MSRPRRFGKSLFLGTLYELLLENAQYFEGLWINSSGYKFIKYPVVRLDMTGDCNSTEALEDNITGKLKLEAIRNELNELTGMTPSVLLNELVVKLNYATGHRVSVLIDEYDTPIQGVIDNIEQAEENRKTLHSFYSALKALADTDRTHLVFVTGVTKFTQTSLFSAFNNLYDLTLDPRYNAVCGFTIGEFEDYFSGYLPEVLKYNKYNGFFRKRRL